MLIDLPEPNQKSRITYSCGRFASMGNNSYRHLGWFVVVGCWRDIATTLIKTGSANSHRELNPNLPHAHTGYAQYLLTLRRIDEALLELRHAQTIDPPVPSSHLSLQYLLFSARRYDEAIKIANPADDHPFVALSYAELGHRREAIAVADRSVRSFSRPVMLAEAASAYAIAGNKGKARKILSAIEGQARERHICGFTVGCVWGHCGR